MIARIYLWMNGQVMVFNEEGEQIPEYQGVHASVKEKILQDAPDSAQYLLCSWQDNMRKELTREEFEKGV